VQFLTNANLFYVVHASASFQASYCM